MTKPKGPVLFDLEHSPPPRPGDAARQPETLHADLPEAPSPAEAPPVPDLGEPAPTGKAMTAVATLATRRPSRLARWFWSLLVGLVGTLVSIAAWNFVTGLVASNPILGWAVAALIAAFGLVVLLIVIKEVSVFARLKRIDTLHHAAAQGLAAADLGAARKVVQGLTAIYSGREDTRWGRQRLKDREGDVFDAEGLLHLAETELLAPLDAQARREVEAAARQVATVTALVPLALADVFAALTSNIRMIRRIGEIYGGRSGTLGSLRLLRAVMSHLVATGAVAVGDDMLEPILGGGLLGKLSRRFGEGLVNGALTARVGVAAMEVCRPLPFAPGTRPSVRGIVSTALSGLFSKDK
ncbi:MAG: TIGR01620 family protein [Roseivivax sp.]|nr:TIGR01620 family protein [Roseivivax sp.]